MNPSWRKYYARHRALFLNTVSRYQERDDLKAYIEIFLSLITISVFSIFALRPTLLTIAKLFKEIDAKEKTLQTMNEKIQNLSSARSLYNKEKDKILLLDTSIPEDAKPEAFVGQIEALSAKHQVQTQKLSLKDAPILGRETSLTISKKDKDQKGSFPKNAQSVPFSIGTTTLIDQFQLLPNFISDFELSRRPAKIDSLRMSTRRGEEEPTISLIIEGRIPYFKSSIAEKK